MKFTLENVGPIKEATIELGKLTIVCGKNNTGKTYLTQTVYEFYKSFRKNLNFSVKTELSQFPIDVDLQDYVIEAAKAVRKSAKNFSNSILKTGTFKIKITSDEFPVDCDAKDSLWVFHGHKIHVTKKGSILHIEQEDNPIAVETAESNKNISNEDFQTVISAIIHNYLFHQKFNDSFISDCFSVMSERNGLVRFKSHINIANGFVAGRTEKKSSETSIERISDDDEKTSEQKLLPLSRSMLHALALFERENAFKEHQQSDFQKQFNLDLDMLVEGTYGIEKGEFFYVPADVPDQHLTMEQCSSSVESLLLLDFYVRYFSEKGDLLIIDEPELNLHPAKQRQLARFLGTLVNAGIKVFITTHSDYIIREFNTMILLKQEKPYIQKIREVEKYPQSQLLNAADIKTYVSVKTDGKVTFEERKISQHKGMAIPALDEVINQMNSIQDVILWGE